MLGLGVIWHVTPLLWYFTDKIVTPNAQDYVFILLQRWDFEMFLNTLRHAGTSDSSGSHSCYLLSNTWVFEKSPDSTADLFIASM